MEQPRGDQLAERVVADLRPATVLVVGLDDGGLTAALRRRGVEVSGPDSDSAETGATYDLVVCVDALERLAPERAESAVTELCARTDDILFSSNPEGW